MFSTQSYKRAAWRQDYSCWILPSGQAKINTQRGSISAITSTQYLYCRPFASSGRIRFLHRAHTEGSAPYLLRGRALINQGSTKWILCDARGRTVRRNRTRLSKPAALRYAGEDKNLNAELSRPFISFYPAKRGRAETWWRS